MRMTTHRFSAEGRVPRGTLVIGALAIMLFALPLAAGTAGSASYRLEQQLTGGGGTSSSTNFKLESCVEPGGAGASSSSSYQMQVGLCTSVFATLATDDDDGDGVPNAVEDGVASDGDGNEDGTADRLQGNVASFPGESGYVTVVSAGAQCSQITSVANVDEASLGVDPNFVYPLGLVSVTLSCASPGDTANLQILFHGYAGPWPLDAYRGFAPSPPGWFAVPGVAFDSAIAPRASFSVTDGGLGDSTGADGTIQSTTGPAAIAPPIPALGGLPLLLLALSLALAGALVVGLGGRSN